ncbi:MAG: glycosyltransferase family 2 protein [Pirellulaceae bacterium]|nr:glycosyltransferase family 2 protein [Pirellulaceae bacterium]
MTTSPILLLVFNRPDLTATMFQEVRKARPQRLFIAADGPRVDKAGEEEKCQQTRAIFQSIDWDCDVQRLYRDANLGCEIAVADAITWFFQKVESGIILEDDCLPDPSFFPYCDELLDRYKDSEKVGVVTGNNFQWGRKTSSSSYYFSKFPHCWGWATWRRAWKLYDYELSDKPENDAAIIGNFSFVPKEMTYWKSVFSSLRSKQLNTWDYRWVRAVWAAGLLTATPEMNLVKNIGYGEAATHTQKDQVVPDLMSMPFPLIHPKGIQQSMKADARVANIHFGLSLRFRIVRKLVSLTKRWLK